MIKYVKSNNNWLDIKNSCRITSGKEETDKEVSSNFKKRILLSEHSPIRMLNITWLWENIKTWVSTHIVRHNEGITHFVQSQRNDRNKNNYFDRNKKPQDFPVNHKCYANAQAIINISRKRLCGKAQSETRLEWINFLKKLKDIEPELYDVCVAECIYRNGLCPEMESCGYNKTEYFIDDLRDYIEIIKDQVKELK